MALYLYAMSPRQPDGNCELYLGFMGSLVKSADRGLG